MEAKDSACLTKKERITKYGEVFTPEWVVKGMCDMLEKENANAFMQEKTFLEPTCGDGAFVEEILRRKFQNCKTRKDYTTALDSVYAMEIQPDNVQKTIQRVTELCRKYFKPTKDEIDTINDHVIQCDSLKIMRMLCNDRPKAYWIDGEYDYEDWQPWYVCSACKDTMCGEKGAYCPHCGAKMDKTDESIL